MNPETKASDWTEDLKAWFDRGQFPSRRRLRAFLDWSGREVANGFGAANALEFGLATLAQATPEERAAIHTWPELKALGKAQEAKRLAAAAARLADHQAGLERRLDEPGFQLFAGENTALIASGTLRECRAALRRVGPQARDPSAHRGCWVIVAPDGLEVEAGEFTREGIC